MDFSNPEAFVGFMTLTCSAAGCDCRATVLLEARSEAAAWNGLLTAAASVGWNVTPGGGPEGPHYCACPHPEARDPR